MGIGPVVGIKGVLPGFNPAATPGLLPATKIVGVKHPLASFAPSSFQPTRNPLAFTPVKPLPGGGGGGATGVVGSPIDSG